MTTSSQHPARQQNSTTSVDVTREHRGSPDECFTKGRFTVHSSWMMWLS
jgi:hypothetical protein